MHPTLLWIVQFIHYIYYWKKSNESDIVRAPSLLNPTHVFLSMLFLALHNYAS